MDNPHRVGKPVLGGFVGEYSARRADYRVIYSIDEGKRVVHITNIDHRRDIYRRR